ncbi:hypothetical protein L195_g044343, partial [Trifolium pratense]
RNLIMRKIVELTAVRLLNDGRDSSNDDDDVAMSTSKDTIYCEKVEPAFDFMKDMLLMKLVFLFIIFQLLKWFWSPRYCCNLPALTCGYFN